MTLRMAGLALAIAFAPAAFAQSSGYEPSRTVDGKPDFSGVWSNTSLTNLERSRQFKDLVITEEVAERMEQATADRNARGAARTDPNSGAPAKGAGVGGYNNFYVDAGSHYAVINGEKRSSWIVEPASGTIPWTEAGKKKFDDELYFVRNNFDGPETRPIAERCLVGFGSTGGPPMINVMYNNHYRFTQTPEHMVILVEMNHDARIIPIADVADQPYQWLGRSEAKWEGDTLVVDTTNFNPNESLRTFFSASFYLSPDAHVEERFSRISDTEMLYVFTVTDPELFSQPWRAEMIFNKSKGEVFEYACHEGNYALPGILAGARRNDRLGIDNFAEASE